MGNAYRLKRLWLAWVLAVVSLAGDGRAQFAVGPDARSEAAIWAAAGDPALPANRETVVQALRAQAEFQQAEACERARMLGLPLRQMRPDGGVIELMAWENGRPLYYSTLNAKAAISTGSNLIRVSPYNANGAGWTVGVWDAGAVRATHREFDGRVTIVDTVALDNHATHVAGTIAASGNFTASAGGMAQAANIASYDWNSDVSEMSGRGASYGGEPGKISISNHSYGYITGWYDTGGTNPKWVWYGSGTTASGYEDDFGRYHSTTRDLDVRTFNLPYYLVFWAAGNDRNNNPATGSNIKLSSGSSTIVPYDPALHPPGDGVYRVGYDTISFHALAKNIVTVGAVNDAESSNMRDLSKATITAFSAWGPTDDGRIKPDLVANGASLYSTASGGDASYATMSGTSMAAPNAAGTAQQLLCYYSRLLPGQYLRASTLKGLLIHTADDLGTPGPDYQFGWGLINARAAADLLASAATNAAIPRLIEQQLTTSVPTRSHTFTWNGVSPIRVTLCWTDPAGSATTSHDSRIRRLVNDLNLRVTGPTGTQHLPYIMPFVGDWSVASISAAATTGVNNTDNVEQVYIAAPPVAGVYQAVITYSGSLANNQQQYALLISGAGPSAPQPQTLLPDTISSGPVDLQIMGEGFSIGATVTLERSGEADVSATVTSVLPTSIACSVDATDLALGAWNVRVTNPDARSGVLVNGLKVVLPVVASVTPDQGESGSVSLTVSGHYFAAGATVYLVREGQADAAVTVLSLTPTTIQGTIDLTSLVQGVWGLRVINPGAKAATLVGAFNVTGTLWSESFDTGAPAGWSAAGGWFLTTAESHTAPAAYRVNGTASKQTDNLTSAGVPVSATAQRLRLHFWHRYNTDIHDGALIELSRDNGATWQAIGSSGSGASFVQGGYTATIQGKKGNPNNHAELVGRSAWTGDSGSGFSEVIVSLDPAVYGGRTLRARWRFSSDASEASEGWVVDSVRLSGYDTANAAPTIVGAAAADPLFVTGVTTALSVLADDDGGEASLIYAWNVYGPEGYPVAFSRNGSNDARETEATFAAAGDYAFVVTVADIEGLSVTSGVAVTVQATARTITIEPAEAEVETGGTQLFTATARDQFGQIIAPEPAYEWSVDGGGAMDATGLFTASGGAGGPYTVTAALPGGISGQAQVTVFELPPVYWSLAVAASPEAGGTVTGAGLYETGVKASISATPRPSWRFTHWSGEGILDPLAPETQVVIDTDKRVTAHFAVVGTRVLIN